MKKFLPALCLISVAACAPMETLQEYRPVVDESRINAEVYEKDLTACRAVATKAETEYKERQEKEMANNMLAGLLVGAAVGAASGNNRNWIGGGAAYGAAAGVAATDTELAQGGPRRIIDRCMANRGYSILNDLGRG